MNEKDEQAELAALLRRAQDLADRCDNIMKNIQSELRKAPKGFCLELINKKEA